MATLRLGGHIGVGFFSGTPSFAKVTTASPSSRFDPYRMHVNRTQYRVSIKHVLTAIAVEVIFFSTWLTVSTC
jgi:hypothetical protein